MGLSQEQLLDNQSIQGLLTQYAGDPVRLNSIIHNQGASIKIRNFQALIDKCYSHNYQKETTVEIDDGTTDSAALTKGMLNLQVSQNNTQFQVMENYVKPIFRVEKV